MKKHLAVIICSIGFNVNFKLYLKYNLEKKNKIFVTKPDENTLHILKYGEQNFSSLIQYLHNFLCRTRQSNLFPLFFW